MPDPTMTPSDAAAVLRELRDLVDEQFKLAVELQNERAEAAYARERQALPTILDERERLQERLDYIAKTAAQLEHTPAIKAIYDAALNPEQQEVGDA